MDSIIAWLEESMLSCFYKKNFGLECPGCGMQRSLVLLLKGDIVASIKMFPALIPMLAMFVFLILHLIFKFEKGGIYLKYFFIFTVSIIVVNYIFKQIYFGIH